MDLFLFGIWSAILIILIADFIFNFIEIGLFTMICIIWLVLAWNIDNKTISQFLSSYLN